ncbi:uncharacterized protein LOC113521746 [Galleria mellonella]|uniref:Uncharacterized protein LOC113521746 n=1 Tax=Galleria mellonella TaxID=7137 RepID=A0A6J1X1J1_GALME|nr:uncharacterized protein LOC113521746 [Galleria mellonella]
MAADIAGFICAVVLAALVLAWIAYCMFVKERPKAEYYQYNICDLQHRQQVLSETPENNTEKKEVAAGIFILPSRHKNVDDSYKKRPDYPESPPPVKEVGTDKLVEIFNENSVGADVHHKDGIYQVDSSAPYDSEV